MVRAIPFHELGGPEVLRYEELPVREPGPGEVLSLGPDVADWAPGDAVSVVPSFSPNDFPVYAEEALVPTSALVARPPAIGPGGHHPGTGGGAAGGGLSRAPR